MSPLASAIARRRRTVLRAAAVLGVFLAVAEAYCLHAAARHLRAGDAALARGDVALARLSWESAAARPAPFNGYAEAAMGRLTALEKSFEGEGNPAEALRLCFSIRGIARSVDGPLPFYREEEKYVEGRIPALAAVLGVELSPDRYTPYRPIRAWASLPAILCFAGFVLAAFAALREGGRGRTVRAGLLAAGLFLLWLLLLRAA